jgi:hypothetical protein
MFPGDVCRGRSETPFGIHLIYEQHPHRAVGLCRLKAIRGFVSCAQRRLVRRDVARRVTTKWRCSDAATATATTVHQWVSLPTIPAAYN